MMLKMGDIEYPSLEGKVSDAEWQTRVELAAMYRTVELMGWNDFTQAPLSAKVPGEPHYLFNPTNLLFDEITASSLVKIDLEGKIVADTPFTHLLPTWYPLKAVHAVRDDANFVMHTHEDYITALSARKDKLLPISQSGAFGIAGGVGYHAYDGVETYPDRIPPLQSSLGPRHVLILENHGAVIVGHTAWQAIFMMEALRKACRIQILAGRADDLVFIESRIIDSMRQELMRGPAVGNYWDSLLRRLDRIDPSYRH